MATRRSSPSASAPEVPADEASDDAATAGELAGRPRPLTARILLVCRLAFAAQFVWLAAFSTVEYQRGDLTIDFSIFDQARWLLTHGHWDPYDTVVGYPFWRSHGEVLMWPLAQLTRLPPGGLWLLWIQAAAIAGCGWVALSWLADLTSSKTEPRLTPWLLGLSGVLMLADPWSYQTAAFDFHFQALAALFALLAARELFGPARRRLWAWATLILLSGDVSALYLVGVSISGLLVAGRDRRRSSLALGAAGLAWLAMLTALHADRGSGLEAGYGYLAGGTTLAAGGSLASVARGLVTHPGRALSHLWSQRVDVWANLAPAGLLGIVSPLGVGVGGLVLLSSLLYRSSLFSVPGFQNFPAYPFVAVGTAALLGRLHGASARWAPERLRRVGLARPAAVTLGALAVAWAVVWLPRYPSEWLTVTPSGASALAEARALIPADAEVVASQGVAGRFADRPGLYTVLSVPLTVPVGPGPVYFVLTPTQGIEAPVISTQSALASVAQTLGASLLEHRAGIWVFRWLPPPDTTQVTLQAAQDVIPAWTLRTTAGTVSTSGPAPYWFVAGDGYEGYVVYGDYWMRPVGRFDATVDMSTTGLARVEVWNANTNTLLAAENLSAFNGRRNVTVPFTQSVPGGENIFTGVGPLAVRPLSPPAGQPVEVRVFDPGGSLVDVYTVGVSPAGGPTP